MRATLSRRLGALEAGRADASARLADIAAVAGRLPRLIAANDGETADQAVARWKAENPGEIVPEEREGVINFIVLRALKPLGAKP